MHEYISGKCLLTKLTRPSQKDIFSQKSKKTKHSAIYFNNALVAKTNCQKCFGMYLNENVSFPRYIKEKTSTANKGVGEIQKLVNPRNSLITIYKSFVRPNCDYCDRIYDQPNIESFYNRIQTTQKYCPYNYRYC